VEYLSKLSAPPGDVETGWELLAGEKTTIDELAELIYGEWTPDTAWAVYLLLDDGLYFGGRPEEIVANTEQEVEAIKADRLAKAAELEGWHSFLQRAREGKYIQSEERYLQDVVALALGRSDKSRVLSALDKKESQEGAHSFLLKLGYWDDTINPYPTRAKVATKSASADVPEIIEEDRLDLTHLAAYAIDDQGSRDPDDAISLEDNRLWVHIADVGALIKPDSLAEQEARSRGANLYLPEGTITMLPQTVTDRLGLGLTETSPSLSFGMDIDQDGELSNIDIVPSWIRVTRLTYDEVETRLGDDPFAAIYEICTRFQQQRTDQGAINIELPEVSVRVVDDKVVIRPLPNLRSRDLVREVMLMTGNAVAHYVRSNAIPIPFTTQDQPSGEIPRARTVSEMFALRRQLRPSQYSNSPASHAGLGLDLYVQVTSPLRRYLDLLVHQQLRASTNGLELLSYQDVLLRVGSAEAVKADLRWVERRSTEHWKLVYLLQHPSWEGDGIVVDNKGSHALVLLPELGLETRIYQKKELPLNYKLRLELVNVDLPYLTTHFREV
jgi:exoribonuclease-2